MKRITRIYYMPEKVKKIPDVNTRGLCIRDSYLRGLLSDIAYLSAFSIWLKTSGMRKLA